MVRNRQDQIPRNVRKKIVTPDIVLYNNFWLDESEEFHCLNTTYYVLSNGDASEEYLLGLLNSDAVQFYYRRIAPTYKDEFLRYISEYLEEIPIPDPKDASKEGTNQVERLASDLQDRVAEYHDRAEVSETPTLVFEREDITRDSLSLAGYVERMDFENGDITDVYTDGITVHLNVSETVECQSDRSAEAFTRLIELMGYETADELDDAEVPRTEEDLLAFIDAYETAAEGLDEVEAEIVHLEAELNEAVYELYELDEETRKYIESHVETPTTPIRPKAMSDE